MVFLKCGSNRSKFGCLLLGSVMGVLAATGGCRRSDTQSDVVAYVALDAEFSEPLLKRYVRERGVTVRPVFDVESTKTVGLVNRILAERRRPRCDVFWNNEILHTIRLQQLGLLVPFQPPDDYEAPSGMRDRRGHWYGFATRARVLLVRRELATTDDRPKSVTDLVAARWKGRCGIARPLFGTSATHAAVLRARWGGARFVEFYRQIQSNARVYSGNRQVAEAVARGEIDWGITDTDDAIVQIEKGNDVAIVFPDQGQDQPGALLIPNTVACLKGSPHPRQAIELARFILSREVELALARGASAQIPVREDIRRECRLLPEKPLRIMEVDFHAAARAWEEAADELRQIFLEGPG